MPVRPIGHCNASGIKLCWATDWWCRGPLPFPLPTLGEHLSATAQLLRRVAFLGGLAAFLVAVIALHGSMRDAPVAQATGGVVAVPDHAAGAESSIALDASGNPVV